MNPKIDAIIEFINIFAKQHIFLTDYRKYLCDTIQQKYTPEQFLVLENQVEDIWWQIRDKLQNKYYNVTNYSIHKSIDDIKLNNYYRSFINKLIMYDSINDEYYVKDMEGSSEIFIKNYLNLACFIVLFDEILLNKVLEDENIDINFDIHYVGKDYGFPNLNTCKHCLFTNEEKLKRIKKYYYEDNNKYWYKLIR